MKKEDYFVVSFAVDLVVVAVAADVEPLQLLGLCLYSRTHTHEI